MCTLASNGGSRRSSWTGDPHLRMADARLTGAALVGSHLLLGRADAEQLARGILCLVGHVVGLLAAVLRAGIRSTPQHFTPDLAQVGTVINFVKRLLSQISELAMGGAD